MTTRHPANIYPGQQPIEAPRRYPMPPPEVPKKSLPWFTLMMMGFAAVLLIGMAIGFWRAASPPDEAITPSNAPNSGALAPTPATPEPEPAKP
jgi:hypothetical protein